MNRSSRLPGDRPSAYAEIKSGAKQDGTIAYWSSKSWGIGRTERDRHPAASVRFPASQPHSPAHFGSDQHGRSRAWRAPNHPQACFLTMTALDDLAAALKMDPLELFMKNLQLTQSAARSTRKSSR